MPEYLLEKYLNRKVKNIYVTGYSEKRNNCFYFSTMNWWFYIEFENNFLCIESDEVNGTLSFSDQNQIKCNFSIESEDVFTVTPISKATFSEVLAFDLFTGKNDSKNYALGVEFKDGKYVFFNSLDWDAIKIGGIIEKDNFLKDDRFSFLKIL